MSIKSTLFGKLNDSEDIVAYTLSNENAMEVTIIEYGATIQSIKIPKLADKLDVVLGYDNLRNYISDKGNYFGATVGRNSNRICDARFVIDSVIYDVDKNNSNNNLHSGYNGFNSQKWKLDKTRSDFESNILALTLYSPHLSQGFPGNLKVTTIFELDNQNQLKILYEANSDLKTIFNPTNHSYFNLNAHNSGSILNKHKITIFADKYTPTREDLIPTGELKKVCDKFDLTKETLISEAYDDNFVVENYEPYLNDEIILKKMAVLKSYDDKIKLEVLSSMPAIQLYTGEFINSEGLIGKDGFRYPAFAGLCLETQFSPDSINQENFSSPLIKSNRIYKTKTIYKFEF